MTNLNEVFLRQPAIEYGPFRVTKALSADWRRAHTYVNGHFIEMPPMQKTLLALLAHKKGEEVTLHALLQARHPDRYTGEANINKEDSLMKVHAYSLRKAVKSLPEGGIEAAKMIVPSSRSLPVEMKRIPQPLVNLNAYRILLPSPHNI